MTVPLAEGLVCAGFPSLADDHLQQPIDLNELCIRNPPATFLVRATGESMLGAHVPRPVDPEAEAKQRRLMAAVNALNLHHGRGTVRPATMGFEQQWQARAERKSPCYTTRLEDVPRARL